jgi:hypothetical protein
MNLISCEGCGTVININRIKEPDIYEGQNGDTSNRCDPGDINLNHASWNNDSEKYEPTIKCPSCKNRIFYKSGDSV